MPKLSHVVEYAGFLVVKGVVRGLPDRAARPLGRGLGALAHAFARGQRKLADANLKKALPALGTAERRDLCRENFHAVGAVALDLLSAQRLTAENLDRRVSVEGQEHFESARARGKGVILLGAHLGSWEIACAWLARHAAPFHVVADRLSNPYFDRLIRDWRESAGTLLIRQRGAGRRMYRALACGGSLGVLLDQRTRPEDAVGIELFGQHSLTSPVPAHLAIRVGSPAVPFVMLPVDGGYRLVFDPPIDPASEGEEAVARLTQCYVAALEAQIRRHPALWQWMYRRWRPERDLLVPPMGRAGASKIPPL